MSRSSALPAQARAGGCGRVLSRHELQGCGLHDALQAKVGGAMTTEQRTRLLHSKSNSALGRLTALSSCQDELPNEQQVRNLIKNTAKRQKVDSSGQQKMCLQLAQQSVPRERRHDLLLLRHWMMASLHCVLAATKTC